MRVSVKDLFIILAFGAVLSWCVAETGMANPLFWIAALVSAAMSVTFVALAKNAESRWATIFAPLGFCFFCMFPLGSTLLLYLLLAFFVAGVACACLPPFKVRTLWVFAMVCVTTSFLCAAFEGKMHVRKLMAIRQEFPIVSLANRLQYETESADDKPASNLVRVELSAAVGNELAQFEQDLSFSWRERDLQQIHSREYERFIRASGFGVGRMARPNAEVMRLEPLRNIAFNEHEEDPRYQEGDWSARYRERHAETVPELHIAARNDFLNPEGFGAVLESVDRVAGFVSHALHVPVVRLDDEARRLEIERLELVSLLRFDEPRVYVLDHLPRMDQLSSNDAPTRPLDEFEAAALKRLLTDEDVVAQEVEGQHRMLGSLRATKQCIECHNVQRGELLGAFTYFIRQSPVNDGQQSATLSALGAFRSGDLE